MTDSKLNWVTQDRQLRECYFRFHRFARISDFTPFFVFSYKGNRKHNIIILCMRYLKSSAYWHLACDVVLYLIMRIKCQERRCSCVGDGVNCQRALLYTYSPTACSFLCLQIDACSRHLVRQAALALVIQLFIWQTSGLRRASVFQENLGSCKLFDQRKIAYKRFSELKYRCGNKTQDPDHLYLWS